MTRLPVLTIPSIMRFRLPTGDDQGISGILSFRSGAEKLIRERLEYFAKLKKEKTGSFEFQEEPFFWGWALTVKALWYHKLVQFLRI